MVTIVIEFLMVNCPSAYNGVLGKPLLRALIAITSIAFTSIHCLTMQFPTMVRIGQV